ncbi:MAG TPA: protein kinase, partial [Thermoanaerobaculia bacterium]|nr:protein kinase [Thermoanaerobaculia bacterium]
MSGLEVLEEVRKSRSRAEFPVIMATARDASEDIVEALTRGANDYVTKPIDFGVVLARVETQISLKRARDQVDGLNRNLLAAQERIARLEASSDEAVRDVGAWSGTMAEDVAVTLGAAALGVFAFDNGEVEPLFSDGLPTPSGAALVDVARRRDPVLKGDEWLVPVVGLSGDLVGGLVVAGKKEGLSTEERRLLQSFAHQLGGALELSRVRYELSAARERAQETRQEMLKKGIDLLQVCPVCGACYDQKATACSVDGRTLSSRRLIPYRVADRYRLVRVLGEGGMGTVFRAYDVKLDRDVAIKILKPEHFDDPSLRLRFENEARAAARIDHPGVVAVYDSGQLGDGSLFLVMELLEGSDLATVLERSGRGRPREVAELLRQGAAALAAAHRANLIHRDVKPENVFLVDRPGGFQVKIVDFGVAKQMNVDLHLTKTGLIVGTPAYMSPEQLEGKEVDARSDVYSLAAVAYEALSGRRVTLEEDLAQIFVDVLQREPPRLSTLVLGIPAEVDQAFAVALAKSPVLRPWDVEQWVASFAHILERSPSDAIGWLDRGTAAEGAARPAHFQTQQMPSRESSG